MKKSQWAWIALLAVGVVGWWIARGAKTLSPELKTVQLDQRVKGSDAVVPLINPNAPKMAIVLDDWGYNINNLPALNKMDVPMTLSILPHLRFSTQISNSLAGKKYEIILHMPMEAHNHTIRAEEKTIYTSMSDEEIRETLKGATASIPNLKGISNHMGSQATEDPRVMKIVMEELQKGKLYFLDSLVTSQSVAEEVSKQVGISFAKRSVFLDNHLDAEYIKGQLLKTAEKAKRNGSAIGIGHDRAVTLKVIQEVAPKLQEEGIQFVYVSQLTRRE